MPKERVLPVIAKTRDMLLPSYGTIEAMHYKSEMAHDAVTQLDQDVENFLKKELQSMYPDISFVGEEFGGDRQAERFWLCDPIDGTAHFIRGLPFCSVMLALIEEGQVNFSAIYDFVNDTMYHATRGQGAYKNEAPIHVSDRAQNMYFGSETHLDKEENSRRFYQLLKKGVTFKTVSAGYEYVLVATGKLEGRVNFDPYGKDYDFAPGSLLVSEAGGIVANIGKRTYDFRNTDFIAANPHFFDMLTTGPDAIFPVEGA